jgi:hypothetical protein
MDVDQVPAQKRPATGDVQEPADKRQRAQERPPPRDNADDLLRGRSSAGGILALLAREIHGPIPYHADAYVTVNTANMNNFFSTVRSTLIEMVYPGQQAPVNIITEADWNLVMRALVKSRVDHVYTNISGLRPNARIPMPRSFEIPKCIADLANGIGFVTIL